MDSQRQDHVTEERYLDIHEAAQILDISEDELWKLAHEHQILTHNIAGAFLRFRKDEIEELKIKWRIERELFPKPQPLFSHEATVGEATRMEKLRDFWYFNDFYILSSALVIVLVYFILSAQ